MLLERVCNSYAGCGRRSSNLLAESILVLLVIAFDLGESYLDISSMLSIKRDFAILYTEILCFTSWSESIDFIVSYLFQSNASCKGTI